MQLSKWLTGKELIERWGLKDFELLNYVLNGLRPYHGNMKPALPPDLVNIKSSIWITRNEIHKYEESYNGFSGEPIDIKRWRLISIKGVGKYPEKPGATYYSDGSTDEIRQVMENLKSTLKIYETELAQYPDLPSWKNYKRPESNTDIKCLDYIVLNAYFKLEDVEAIELAIDTGRSIPVKVASPQRRSQKDKEIALEIAKEHVSENVKEKKTPILAEGISLVKKKLTVNYLDKTIRSWIKTSYPPESRKPGRKPGWQDRSEES